MELIILTVSGVFAILLAAEFQAWRPTLTRILIHFAAGKMPIAWRSRCIEEWSSHIDGLPGDISKLFAAAGFLLAAARFRAATELVPRIPAIRLVLFHSLSILLIAAAVAIQTKGQAFTRTKTMLFGRSITGWTFQKHGRFGQLLESTGLDRLPLLWTAATDKIPLPDGGVPNEFNGIVLALRKKLGL